jgi:hypothetical protein
MAGAFFWIGLLVSTVGWFVGDWIAGKLWPGDYAAGLVLGFVFAVIGGGLFMTMLRIRGLRSGRYEKTDWGVRKKSRWEK